MCLLSAGMERISPTSYKTKAARWTNGDGTTLEAGFWAPYQPKYSRAHKYAYVTRSFSTTYPYRYQMSLASKWRTFTFVCQRQACLSSQLLCSNGVCGYGRACDGVDGCGDRSDEANCRKCTRELNLIMITWNWDCLLLSLQLLLLLLLLLQLSLNHDFHNHRNHCHHHRRHHNYIVFIVVCDPIILVRRHNSQHNVERVVQERRNSTANALELRLYCTYPSMLSLLLLLPWLLSSLLSSWLLRIIITALPRGLNGETVITYTLSGSGAFSLTREQYTNNLKITWTLIGRDNSRLLLTVRMRIAW